MALATGATVRRHIDPARVRDTGTGRLVDAIRHTTWRSIVRPRTIVYFVVWAGIGLAMLTVLSLRSPLDLNVLHDRNPLYVQLGGRRDPQRLRRQDPQHDRRAAHGSS